MKTLLLSGTAVAMLAVSACEDAAGPAGLDEAFLLDAAVVAADATLEDIGIMGNPFGFGTPGAMGSIGSGRPGRPGGQQGIGGSLSGTREVTFYDADGFVQEAYDALSTERIEAVIDVAGDVARNNWSASIARTRNMVVTGLAGENTTRTVNGSGTEDVSRSLLLTDGETATRDMTGSFTYTNLVVPTPDQEVRYPLSGTITREMVIVVVNGINGNVNETVSVVITFDGSSTATGTINGETFEIDLAARTGQFPLRGGFGRNFGG